MNTLETIAHRRSYRGPYAPTPVPRADLIKIMEAGFHAPSGCNKQTTSFLAVDDPRSSRSFAASSPLLWRRPHRPWCAY